MLYAQPALRGARRRGTTDVLYELLNLLNVQPYVTCSGHFGSPSGFSASPRTFRTFYGFAMLTYYSAWRCSAHLSAATRSDELDYRRRHRAAACLTTALLTTRFSHGLYSSPAFSLSPRRREHVAVPIGGSLTLS